MMKYSLTIEQTLLVADTDHENGILINYINEIEEYDILIPPAKRRNMAKKNIYLT